MHAHVQDKPYYSRETIAIDRTNHLCRGVTLSSRTLSPLYLETSPLVYSPPRAMGEAAAPVTTVLVQDAVVGLFHRHFGYAIDMNACDYAA